MKKLFLTLFTLIITLSIFSQSTTITQAELDSRIATAVSNNDFEEAAKLKKDKDTLEKLNTAIRNGDYEKASYLKKQISTTSKAEKENLDKKNQEIQAKIKIAIQNEDYAEAARLKKQLTNHSNTNNNNNSDKEAEEKRKKEIQAKINIAVENGNYEEAAKLKASLNEPVSKVKYSSTNETSSSSSNVKPEFINQVYAVKYGKTASLEKVTGEIKSKVSASPWHSSATSFYYVQGTNSSVKLSSNTDFIVETSAGLDPSEYFKLVKFDADKRGNDRWLPYYQSGGGAFHHSGGKVDNNNIPIDFKRKEGNIFEINIKDYLPSGEYGFMYINKFYCFSVD